MMKYSTLVRQRIAEALREDDKAALDRAVKSWISGVLSDDGSTKRAPIKRRYYRRRKELEG